MLVFVFMSESNYIDGPSCKEPNASTEPQTASLDYTAYVKSLQTVYDPIDVCRFVSQWEHSQISFPYSL